MSFERIDLNLLRVFEAVLQHRSVSMAGRDLGVTASAISHALGRLRQALGDELFVYGDGGMTPTARALELAPGIRDGLGRIEATILSRPFDPVTSTRTFRIAASDYSTTHALVPFIARLAERAPLIELKVFPYSRLDMVRQLDEGQLDLALGWFSEVPERMRRSPVIADHEALAVRPGHPLAGRPVTREEIFAYPFVVVELTGSEDQGTDGFVDDRGVWRRVWIDRLVMETDAACDAVGHVAVSLPHYAAVADILAATDMVATLPARHAIRAAEEGRVALLSMPHDPLRASVDALWHQRGDSDPGLKWLVREIAAAVAGA
ncbi:LysR family transcriptional regulator [Segnochrobactraceae bacterium EtOH-i3]